MITNFFYQKKNRLNQTVSVAKRLHNVKGKIQQDFHLAFFKSMQPLNLYVKSSLEMFTLFQYANNTGSIFSEICFYKIIIIYDIDGFSG